MPETPATTASADELTDDQKRQNFTRLAFDGSEARYTAFVEVVRAAVPPGTGVVLRGSAVTGVRWKDKAPFDADGQGTSDLDLTLVGGDDVIGLYKVTGFFVPGVHSRPLSDEDPDIAPDLVPLRGQYGRRDHRDDDCRQRKQPQHAKHGEFSHARRT
ncbi:MAG: hypothetical protein ABIP65_08545, partial [Vicinamibacterales bacterium]